MTAILNLVKGILGKVLAFIPASVIAFYESYKTPVLILLIALCVLMSLEGYKIFKGALYVIVAGGFGFVGYKYVAGFLLSKIGGMLPAAPMGLSYEALIAFVLALGGVFFVKFAYKFTIMMMGGAIGFVIGYLVVAKLIIKMFPTLGFLNSTPAKAVIGLVIAAIMGIFFILLFKHLFILGTALGCMALAGMLTVMVLMPAAGLTIKLGGAALGLIVGIYSTIHQYNEEQRATDIRFYA